jgi:hypothetical protein
LTDPYHNILRLNLYRFDGSPLPPMYIAYQPPTMLPTTTLHPTATAKSKMKRAVHMQRVDAQESTYSHLSHLNPWLNPNHWWWCGLAFTGIGSILFFYF